MDAAHALAFQVRAHLDVLMLNFKDHFMGRLSSVACGTESVGQHSSGNVGVPVSGQLLRVDDTQRKVLNHYRKKHPEHGQDWVFWFATAKRPSLGDD